MYINKINTYQNNNSQKVLNFKGSYSAINKGVKELIAKDSLQEQPLFISVKDDFLSKFLKNISDNKDQNFIIGIAGESASGKTTIVGMAEDTFQKKDIPCTILNADDYYKDASKIRKDAGSFYNFLLSGYSLDEPNAVNLPLLKTHLLTLKNGTPIKSPQYDFLTSGSTPDVKPKNPARIILHEGLFVLNDEFDDVSDAKIYVKVPFEDMKQRWFKRTIERETVGEEADFQFKDVTSKAKAHIYPQEQKADIVLNGLSDIDYQKEVFERIIDLTV